MTRRRTSRDDGRRPTPARWIGLGGRGKFKTWQLAGTRYFVRHCGHPTANYPWYGERPDGSMITSGNDGRAGMAFRYLDDAKVAVELDHAGEYGAIALFAAHRSRARSRLTTRTSPRHTTACRRSARANTSRPSSRRDKHSTTTARPNTPERTEQHDV